VQRYILSLPSVSEKEEVMLTAEAEFNKIGDMAHLK